jgi:ankyrin repeat protein
MINQPDKRRQYQTPLHIAAGKKDLRGARELIKYGAYIDAYDNQHKTPLFLAVEENSQDVAEFLLDHGAQLDIRSTANETLIEVAFANENWKMASLLLESKAASKRLTFYGENLLNRMTRTQTSGTEHNLTLFHHVLDNGDDLYQSDIYGLSAFHNLFLHPCFVYLRSLLETGPELQVCRQKGWPDLFFVEGTERLVEVTKSFRYVRHKLNRDEMLQLSDAANPGIHSLLCRAACWNSVEAIQNITGLGIHRFEHRCDEHGTPLNAAISDRRFEAVQCLVRNGAPVPTELCLPKDSTISTANFDFVIREWLFIGRHNEHRRILNGSVRDEAETGRWAGVWVARVAMPWAYRKSAGESILEYAKRRGYIVRYKMRNVRVGKLVQPKS